jgi:hypothetical protein
MIVVPLFCLAVCALFFYMYVNSSASITEQVFGSSYDPNDIRDSHNQTLNEEQSELSGDLSGVGFVFTSTTLFYAIAISAFTVICAGSLTIMGSGLGSGFGRSMGALVMYYGLWFLFSASGLLALLAVPLFGILLYFVMSVVYTLGVYSEVA